MKATCSVRVTPDGPWKPGQLTNEAADAPGLVVVRLEGEARTRGIFGIDLVKIAGDCPPRLLDEAVESGFCVLGVPRGNHYQVVRLAAGRERIMATGLSPGAAQGLADRLNAGPDGPTRSDKAVYEVRRLQKEV